MASEADTPQHPESDAASAPVVRDEIVTATLRRAPRVSVFLVLGGLVGVLVALVLTFAFNGNDNAAVNGVVYSDGQVFGFLALVGATVGVFLGGLVAIILDRVASRRAKTVTVDHETVQGA